MYASISQRLIFCIFRYLPTIFSYLPAQGISVRLSGVVPVNGESHFSKEVIRYFTEIMINASGSTMKALITGKKSTMVIKIINETPFADCKITKPLTDLFSGHCSTIN